MNIRLDNNFRILQSFISSIRPDLLCLPPLQQPDCTDSTSGGTVSEHVIPTPSKRKFQEIHHLELSFSSSEEEKCEVTHMSPAHSEDSKAPDMDVGEKR